MKHFNEKTVEEKIVTPVLKKRFSKAGEYEKATAPSASHHYAANRHDVMIDSYTTTTEEKTVLEPITFGGVVKKVKRGLAYFKARKQDKKAYRAWKHRKNAALAKGEKFDEPMPKFTVLFTKDDIRGLKEEAKPKGDAGGSSSGAEASGSVPGGVPGSVPGTGAVPGGSPGGVGVGGTSGPSVSGDSATESI